jgi:hypothetical protein
VHWVIVEEIGGDVKRFQRCNPLDTARLAVYLYKLEIKEMENAYPDGLHVSTMDAPCFIKAAHVSILLVERLFYANCLIASYPLCQGGA